ncbi:MAG: hypothetical protein R3F19_31060 [Verrucomicrobiales bacterium]
MATALVQRRSPEDQAKLLEFLNSATLERIREIPGIGGSTASSIIEGRPCKTIEERMNIYHRYLSKKFNAVVEHAWKI